MRKGNPEIREFDLSCFNGEYVTGDVSDSYLSQVEALRSDDAKTKRATAVNALNDLHVSSESLTEV